MAKRKNNAVRVEETVTENMNETVQEQVVQSEVKEILTKEQFEELDNMKTWSLKIRYLHSLGLATAKIASLLSERYKEQRNGKEVRYQHVRNVLTTVLKRPTVNA